MQTKDSFEKFVRENNPKNALFIYHKNKRATDDITCPTCRNTFVDKHTKFINHEQTNCPNCGQLIEVNYLEPIVTQKTTIEDVFNKLNK